MRTARADELLPGDEVWWEDEDGRDCAANVVALVPVGDPVRGYCLDLDDGTFLELATSDEPVAVPDTVERHPRDVHQGDVVRHFGIDGRLRDSLVLDNPVEVEPHNAFEILLEDDETLFVLDREVVEVVR